MSASGPPIRGRAGRLALAAATVVYLVLLASQTLGPQPEAAGGVLSALTALMATSSVTAWITYPVLEFVANIVLFVPLGVLWVGWAGRRRWWWAAAAGLLVSAAIEATQGLLLPDRFADVRDLVSNTLGALLGAAAVAAVTRPRLRR
ncbi:VanZ family protein [Microbacterium sp. W1N]|uniref:VanZ family protein n=1 Tax=Microbacterium festucae TaxID=2977531 RepID=UPI0021C12B85|nr:VanZ family protein [Microbacterium festucae]MCT9820586.1 VanZ family protein [Microbacterium festucae]